MATTTVHPFARAGASAASATFFACSFVIDRPYGGSFGPAAGRVEVSLIGFLLFECSADR
jgi:hypothetical protein